MGGFMGGAPEAPAVDNSAANAQAARLEEQRAEQERQNAARRRLLSGRAGAGSRLLRFAANDDTVPGAAGGTAATVGG